MDHADVLIGFGIVLSIVGVTLFARSKGTAENSMEIAGMKVKVSHPALLVFFAGVALMLAPLLLKDGQVAGASPDDELDEAAGDGAPDEEGADTAADSEEQGSDLSANEEDPSAEPGADEELDVADEEDLTEPGADEELDTADDETAEPSLDEEEPTEDLDEETAP